KHTMRFKLMTAAIICFVGIGVFLFAGEGLINMYLKGEDAGLDVAKTFISAKGYLAIMLICLVPFALENVYSSTLREGGIATVPMYAGIVAVVTNTVLNALLIFGIGPFPVMGVKGAAIATVISRFVQTGIVVFWTHKNRNSLVYPKSLYRSLFVPKELVKRITIKGLIPLTANECLWGLGIATLAACYSVRGVDVVAGQNISSTVVNLFNVLFIAFGSGVSVVIGQLLGANELEEAKDAAPKLITFSTLLCVVVGSVMALCAPLFPLMYNTTDNVRELATAFIIIRAIWMPAHGMLHATYFTLRSGGKTVITFFFDCGFSWIVSVPLAYCLANFTGLGIITIYFIVQSAELIKCVIGAILIKKGVWLSNIVK
ncbi:MAG: polysaccharide biosynthesis C-terminal domain-containing protein, partial [Oscillospiraceae bacterium]|nr:polysaccharide biosynthesis C-terminal domain-containing protein [Oscillospiraceae bacterium]